MSGQVLGGSCPFCGAEASTLGDGGISHRQECRARLPEQLQPPRIPTDAPPASASGQGTDETATYSHDVVATLRAQVGVFRDRLHEYEVDNTALRAALAKAKATPEHVHTCTDPGPFIEQIAALEAEARVNSDAFRQALDGLASRDAEIARLREDRDSAQRVAMNTVLALRDLLDRPHNQGSPVGPDAENLVMVKRSWYNELRALAAPPDTTTASGPVSGDASRG